MGKFAEKFLNMMKIDDYDEYEDEYMDEYEDVSDEYESWEDEEQDEAPAKKPFISFRRKKKEELVEEEMEQPVTEQYQSTVIPIRAKQGEGEIVKVIKPQDVNEAKIVADFLKEGKTTIVNLEGIEISQAQRIIDIISGASFAIDGTLKAISNNIFIVAPGNIEVSGDLRNEIINENMVSPELSQF